MSQSLTLNQSCCHQQVLQLTTRLSLSMDMKIAADRLRKSGGASDPKLLFDQAVVTALSGPENATIRGPLTTAFAEDRLRTKMLNAHRGFAVPTEVGITDFVLSFMFGESAPDGTFMRATDKDGTIIVDPPKTKYGLFAEAFKDQKGLQTRTTEMQEALRRLAARNTTSTVSFLELNEMIDALDVMEPARPVIESLRSAILLLLTRKDSQGRYVVKEFFLDYSILEKLDLILSDRLQRRFVARFKRVSGGSKAYGFEEAFMNTIAEFVLMSMGIISPGIFKPQKGEMNGEMFASIAKDLKPLGCDLRSLYKRYNLHTDGAFFWNRYHIVGHRACRVTDELIRAFIVKTVRADRKEVLAAASYTPTFFPKLTEICDDNYPEDREELLRVALVELCESDDFQKGLLPLLRRWYKHLDMFYPRETST